MSNWQTQRIPNRRRGGCSPALIIAMLALMIVAVVGAVVVIALLPQIGAQLVGLQAAGETERLFIETRAPAAPRPQEVIQNAQPAGQAQVNTGSAGTFTLDTGAVPIQTGRSASGVAAAIVSLTEAEVNNLCRERSTICTGGNGQIRNATIDLKPGGAVIYGEFLVPQVGIWQSGGVVLTIDAQRSALRVAGLDINGTLYSIPNDGLAAVLSDLESRANTLLRETVVSTNGQNYSIREIYADDSRLTVILR